MASLSLVPILLSFEAELLGALGRRLEATFGLRAEVHAPGFDPEIAFDSSRGQYNSRILLARLVQEQPGRAARVLGVAGVDLFIPVLTYVFGEAQLDGRAAIVSTHRLRPEAYGMAPDRELFRVRLEKECLHELGHTWGLIHCASLGCVMHGSTYVEEVDLKGARFCGPCRGALARSGVPGLARGAGRLL